MTENEAIKRIREFGLHHAIGDLPYSALTVKAFKMAIKALEEIQQYRAIGTVDEFRDCTNILNKAYANEFAKIIDEWLLYHKIGTVEECRKAMERRTPKAPNIWGDGYDDKGNMIYDMYDCPNCSESYELDYHNYRYCPQCGQAIDRHGMSKIFREEQIYEQ